MKNSGKKGKKWFLQHRSFGLGNFVMSTPALRMFAGTKTIHVYFETKCISSLYKKCDFIRILDKKPNYNPIASTFSIKKYRQKKRKYSDIVAYCKILKINQEDIPHTYVDKDITLGLDRDSSKKYIAVFHGCLGKAFLKKKDIGESARQFIIDELIRTGHIPVILGNKNDKEKYWKNIRLDGCLNFVGSLSLKNSVSILSQCDCFISNDTGLYHVAGAFGMNGLVLWKRTNMLKNYSPCSSIKHVSNKNGEMSIYIDAIKKYVKDI